KRPRRRRGKRMPWALIAKIAAVVLLAVGCVFAGRYMATNGASKPKAKGKKPGGEAVAMVDPTEAGVTTEKKEEPRKPEAKEATDKKHEKKETSEKKPEKKETTDKKPEKMESSDKKSEKMGDKKPEKMESPEKKKPEKMESPDKKKPEMMEGDKPK